MRYQITITGVLDTSFSEETIRRDFPMFVRSLSQVHGDLVPDSIALVRVEALPEPTPAPVTDDQPTADLSAVLAGLNAITARLGQAGL